MNDKNKNSNGKMPGSGQVFATILIAGLITLAVVMWMSSFWGNKARVPMMSPTMPCSAISESLTTVLIRRFPSSFSPPHLLFSMLSCNSHVSITNYNTKIPEWVSKAVEQAPQRFRQKSASMRNQYRCFESNIDYLSLMLPFLMPQSAERF